MDVRTDRSQLLEQYGSSANLSQRARLHQRYSTAPVPWGRWLREHLEYAEGARILEVGCGAGWLWQSTEAAAARDWRPCLTDLSAGMVAEARSALGGDSRFRFLVADAQQLPFPDDHFDGALACHMLYHVPDRPRAIAELARVLRPGGRLFAATNGGNHLRELWECIDQVVSASVRKTAAQNFGLDNGGRQLAAAFDQVALERYSDSLVVPEVEPLVAYAQSTGRLSADQLGQVERIFRAQLQSGGPIRIQKDVGLFSATKGAEPG